MMLNKGKHGSERILSRPSVELMTTDHITPEQKAASDFFPGFWDNRGWGFGVAVITRATTSRTFPGRYGWDGGYGTSWYVDPEEEMVGILMTQRVWDSPAFRASIAISGPRPIRRSTTDPMDELPENDDDQPDANRHRSPGRTLQPRPPGTRHPRYHTA